MIRYDSVLIQGSSGEIDSEYMGPEYMTVWEVSQIANKPQSTVYFHMRRGNLKYYTAWRYGHKGQIISWFVVHQDDFAKFMEFEYLGPNEIPITEASKLLECHPQDIFRMIEVGKLHPVHHGSRMRNGKLCPYRYGFIPAEVAKLKAEKLAKRNRVQANREFYQNRKRRNQEKYRQRDELVVEMINYGYTIANVAERLNLSLYALSHYIKRKGLYSRFRDGWRENWKNRNYWSTAKEKPWMEYGKQIQPDI